MFYVSSRWLLPIETKQPLSQDLQVSFSETAGMPDIVLFDTASICMYALLTRALLTFATLTELKRSESLAC